MIDVRPENDKIMTSAGLMTVEQFERYKQRQKEQKENNNTVIPEPKKCPLINGIYRTCIKTCAWYDLEEVQCKLQSLPADGETVGKDCPLSFGKARAHCSSSCGMSKNGGCTLLSLFRKGAENK